MRIIGNIEHPAMKITVFKMDNRLSVKFETGLYEQIYKFRESDDLQDFQGIQRLVDAEFMQLVLAEFERMHRVKSEALGRFLPETEVQEFPVII
jgi:hypothetical protein